MKGFTIGVELLAMVLIAILVLSWGVSFIIEGRIQPGRTDSDEYVECQYNSDCFEDELCISIDGGDNFCGCLENSDCEDDMSCMSNNKCEKELYEQ